MLGGKGNTSEKQVPNKKKGCCSFGCLCKFALLLPITLVGIAALIGGNYTHMSNMMQRGMPQGEDA